jgi:hypothetical protein
MEFTVFITTWFSTTGYILNGMDVLVSQSGVLVLLIFSVE